MLRAAAVGVVLALSSMVLVAAGLFSIEIAGHPLGLSGIPTLAKFAILLAALAPGFWLFLAASIASQAIAALLFCTGLRAVLYWRLAWIRGRDGWEFRFGRRLPGIAGMVMPEALPARDDPRIQMAALCLAGPLASALFAFLSGAFWAITVAGAAFLHAAEWSLPVRFTAMLSLTVVAATACCSIADFLLSSTPIPPSWLGGVETGAWRAMMWMREPVGGGAMTRSFELLRLRYDLLFSHRPSEIDRTRLARLLWRERDRDLRDHSFHPMLLAATHRFDIGQVRQAERSLRRIEQRIATGPCNRMLRHQLDLILAYLTAVLHGDAKGARARCAAVPKSSLFAIGRGQVEAAILDAEGRPDEALKVAKQTLRLASRSWCGRGIEEDLRERVAGNTPNLYGLRERFRTAGTAVRAGMLRGLADRLRHASPSAREALLAEASAYLLAAEPGFRQEVFAKVVGSDADLKFALEALLRAGQELGLDEWSVREFAAMRVIRPDGDGFTGLAAPGTAERWAQYLREWALTVASEGAKGDGGSECRRGSARPSAVPDDEGACADTAPLLPARDSPGEDGADARRRGGAAVPGRFVGPYKLVSRIGEGGFGEVWMAERREPFVQRVAIKLIKPGMDSKSVVARFEQERQALAVMNHPHIAKVLDGGLTEDGRPYFAMEHVKGEPITDFCDGAKLPIEARLVLFTQACEAVQHAHMKGVIHRDLKPSNILVMRGAGDEPLVKVIDFGVAKAMTQNFTDKTIFTETGQMIGTLEYMSPEQAEPDATDIDTRSDVYSLGVVLYELLAGVLPVDGMELRAKARREVQRIIRDEDTPSPSRRLTEVTARDAARRASIERGRGLSASDLAHRLSSELEWIPMKAMRKAREERYVSPLDLAEDVRRYIKGEKLRAGPRSLAYSIAKRVSRNRRTVAVAVLLVVAVATGVSSSLASFLLSLWNPARDSIADPLLSSVASVVASMARLAAAGLLARELLLKRHATEPLWISIAIPPASYAIASVACAFLLFEGWLEYKLAVLAACIAIWLLAQYGLGRTSLLASTLRVLAASGLYTAQLIVGTGISIATSLGLFAFGFSPRDMDRRDLLRDSSALVSGADWRRFTVVSQDPDPAIVPDPEVRERIKSTGRPWRVRHEVSGMPMLLVPPGDYVMGSPDTEAGRNDDETQHPRRIVRAFYLAEHELTNAEAAVFLGDAAADAGMPDRPWFHVGDHWSHGRFVSDGVFRLPSEAEWEYACRAGTTGPFHSGESVDPEESAVIDVSVWSTKAEAAGALRPVGSLARNPWGFRGMHGSVAEPCADSYTPYPRKGDGDPSFSGAPRVIRGGSVASKQLERRSAFRGVLLIIERQLVGARFACDVDAPVFEKGG